MLLEVRYTSEFAYPTPVRQSHNVLRACPVTDDHQRLVSYQVRVDPAARVLSHIDYWGTRVDEFGVRAPHSELTVVAESVVETSDRPVPAAVVTGRSAYGDADVSLDHHEYLQSGPHTNWGEDLAEFARTATAGAVTAVDVIRSIHDGVADTLAYVPGATFVGMDVNAVLTQRQGVCQDFAHLAIAMCRSVGVPARYVSGYLYTTDQTTAATPDEAEVEIQTHAWIEALVPGWGWWALDPTNRSAVGELHIKIGHGRDYDDVLPMRGTYHGPTAHDLGVAVRISRDALSPVPAHDQ